MYSQLIEKFKKTILKERLYRSGLEVEKEMHNLVAIDTGTLDESIKTDSVIQRTSSLFSVDVGSEGVNYAGYVDQGVRGEEYNYHRHGKVVYRGVGQHWTRRALENTKTKILLILKGSL